MSGRGGTIRSAIIIGTGRVGSAFARVLPNRGIAVRGIISRDPQNAQARFGNSTTFASRISELAAADLLILAVPDDQIRLVAAAAAADMSDGQVTFALHVSGFRSSSVLAQLSEKGVGVASFHPVTAFPPEDSAEDPFAGAIVAVEGKPQAVDAAQALAGQLDARPVMVTADQKRALHAAAAMAANFTTTLSALAHEMLSLSGFDQQTASDILNPLMQSAVDNLRTAEPAQALTGPIVRGDLDIVRAHLELLETHFPHLLVLYKDLGRRTVELALTSERLAPSTAARMKEVLA